MLDFKKIASSEVSFKYTIGIQLALLLGSFVIDWLMGRELQWVSYISTLLSHLTTTPITYYFVNNRSFEPTNVANFALITILNLPISILVAVGIILFVFQL